MEAKYYTPEIEEFHVGFEYESLNNNNEWVKSKYGGFLPFHPQTYIDKKEFRVKHLDRQDIEEFGWKITEDFGYRFYTLNGYSLHFYPNEERNIGILLNKFKIKNKSELKKLMKMFNI